MDGGSKESFLLKQWEKGTMFADMILKKEAVFLGLNLYKKKLKRRSKIRQKILCTKIDT